MLGAAGAATAALLGATLALEALVRAPLPVPAALRRQAAGSAFGQGSRDAGAPPMLPVARWSERFGSLVERGAWAQLVVTLDELAERAPVLYRANRLGYLHARAAQALGDDEQASLDLEPFLEPGDPFRPLALRHATELAMAAGDLGRAAARRHDLLLDHPGSLYWRDTLAEQLAALERDGRPGAVLDLVAEVAPLTDDPRVGRELAAARVAALVEEGELGAARVEGAALLRDSTRDDPAERVALLLARPDLLRDLDAQPLRSVGDSMLYHRQWQRAVDLYLLARRGLPGAKGELDFAIGRARFFAGQYAEAERLFRRAAREARSGGGRARALYHAARSAQLAGREREAESLLGDAIGVRGRFDATAAALTARIRLRVHDGRLRAAYTDLELLRRGFPRDSVLAEGTVALTMGELAAGRTTAARAILARVPPSLDAHHRAEVDYWRARCAEERDPGTALAGYLDVLRADVPTHFAYLARHRLARSPLAEAAAELAGERRREARARLRSGDPELARRLQTDAVLLADGGAEDLAALAAIYRALPAYRAVLEAEPLPLPAFPLVAPTPDLLLSAMALHDEAVSTVGARYPLTPFRSGLTRSVAYRRGGASRASIQAVESLMEQVPDDFLPQLLPRELRELLYPRYFYGWIAADAASYHADPRLLLAIMREESRFNPRAKSPAAARGLLQLLLSTARDVAEGLGLVEVEPEDLYDPRLVIQLGAKYLGDLLAEFDGDAYATAAAYNAGPAQARQWQQLAPAPGPDFFLSTVSFSETRHYVRKVLNSYERYGEIYQGEPPTGGVRAEP